MRGYLVLLASERIAAPPPTRPRQNTFSHQGLEDTLQMPARDSAARSKRFGGKGADAGIESYLSYSSNRDHAAAAQ